MVPASLSEMKRVEHHPLNSGLWVVRDANEEASVYQNGLFSREKKENKHMALDRFAAYILTNNFIFPIF